MLLEPLDMRQEADINRQVADHAESRFAAYVQASTSVIGHPIDQGR
jgi:hypothetical protein